MKDVIILFIYTNKDKLTNTNYESIKRYSRDFEVYPIHQNDFSNHYYNFLDYKHISEWSGNDVWYWGSDNIFLYWYLSNPDKRAKNYLILEYDTYACEDILDFFGLDETFLDRHRGISSALSIFFRTYGPGYWWFDFQAYHPLIKEIYGLDNFSACSPLCSNLISDDAVMAIIKHIKEFNGINKLYVETKFATILKYLKYNVLNFKMNNKHNIVNNIKYYISYDQHIAMDTIRKISSKQYNINHGVYHPIKQLDIIERYFMPNKIEKDKIHKAYFGQLCDIKPGLEILINKANLSKIVIDNSIGGDPAPGLSKKLYIEYTKNNEKYTKILDENTVLDINDL